MREALTSLEQVPSVGEIVATMNRSVAGLDKFKRRLALVMRRHLVAGVLGSDTHPPNLLVIGPSGGGKTHTLTTVLNALPLPWVQAAATEFTDTGFIGTHLPSLYARLLAEPTWREGRPRKDLVPLVEGFGVVVLDEFDKLRILSAADERTMARNRALQAELLTITEGTVIQAKHDDSNDPGVPLRTHGILHIAVGAFQGLSRVVVRNQGHQPTVAEHAYVDAALEDLTGYGFIEELVGRFSAFVTLPPLNADHLMVILDLHVIPRVAKEMADDGLTLVVTDAAKRKFADRAARNMVGARALPSDLEDHLWEAWAAAPPGATIVIEPDHVGKEQADIRMEAAA